MTMKPVSAKASGKFILLGEHFVVPAEGQTASVPALAFPLNDLWCEVKISANAHPHYKANLPDDSGRDIIESYMARATYAAANSLRIDVAAQPFRVESFSNFPVSRGFGSSAAFAVALVRAFDEYRYQIVGRRADWDELQRATSAVERIFHGRPSGVDASVILSGTPIRFENGTVTREIKNNAVDFIAVDSGSRENSSALIQSVVQFREAHPEQWNHMAQAMRECVDRAEAALASSNSIEVAKTMREAHNVLAELGLSSPGIDAIIHESIELGALAGKVSGAGGGGAVLIATNKGDAWRVAQKLRDAGKTVMALSPAQVSGGA